MFIDGGTLTETANRANRSAGLGTWSHSGGSSYSSLEQWFEYKSDGSFNGTAINMREIELDKNADEATWTATTEFFNVTGQLINSGCATATATRFEWRSRCAATASSSSD
jgi:hypothetical protein